MDASNWAVSAVGFLAALRYAEAMRKGEPLSSVLGSFLVTVAVVAYFVVVHFS